MKTDKALICKTYSALIGLFIINVNYNRFRSHVEHGNEGRRYHEAGKFPSAEGWRVAPGWFLVPTLLRGDAPLRLKQLDAAHIRLQYLGYHNAAIGLLIVFQHSH
ncbi:hypothetical protein GCM10011450_26790 [Advenella faeciporci]|uniref:Uncharacterized protein n=1 Tax=Advenella faeciporci TaxID=797535 RepID=A0A918N1X7_9BURK|nr:hypothetical protein GCM10011450_26790 [Advenella faeciporci]